MAQTNLNRRKFLKNAGTIAGGAALFPLLSNNALAARSKELNMLVWEGYNSPNVLDPFRREFGARVSATNVTNDPDAVNRLRAGETRTWDIVNLNNPWARQMMHPEGLIKTLDPEAYKDYFDAMLPEFKWPYEWSMSLDQKELLGVPQRFGPLSFVVNTDKISRTLAENEGFNLFMDPAMKGRYGMLTWADWNIFHMCITAGFSPFKVHTAEEMDAFKQVAEYLFANARFLSDDHLQMNQAMITGEIDAYFTGGTYTCSIARNEGFENVVGITPSTGPIDGKGGIVWIEITSVVNNPNLSPLAEEFLHYIMRPEVCYEVAFAEGSHNPIAQLGMETVRSRFSSQELMAIQYDSLEEDIARCAAYEVNPDYDEMLTIYTAARRGR